ncbi:MAG: hypothetical protein JNM84_02770 [Planctomycetes bacterium]|nr:hypothetical protein [Planctomycetota bacterium]
MLPLRCFARISRTAAATLAALALAGAAFAQEVPFRGKFTGTGFPIAAMTGNANHLGRFQGTGQIIPTGPSTFIGTFEWFAANGDMLYGTLDGTFVREVSPGVFEYHEIATILGGTGRFAGASGTQVATGNTDLVNAVFDGRFDGTIVLAR